MKAKEEEKGKKKGKKGKKSGKKSGKKKGKKSGKKGKKGKKGDDEEVFACGHVICIVAVWPLTQRGKKTMHNIFFFLLVFYFVTIVIC